MKNKVFSILNRLFQLISGKASNTDVVLNEYKFRAECKEDAQAFISRNEDKISKVKIETSDTGLPDVEVTFESSEDPSELRKSINSIPDGHVMYQTLQPINKYTGKRNYQLQ